MQNISSIVIGGPQNARLAVPNATHWYAVTSGQNFWLTSLVSLATSKAPGLAAGAAKV
jgi:hypothetical protein